MKRFGFILVLLFFILGSFAQYPYFFKIDVSHIKHYKSIRKALKDKPYVYVLDIGFFYDKKIQRLVESGNRKKLDKYLSKINELEYLYSLCFDYLDLKVLPNFDRCQNLTAITISRMNKLDWNIFFKQIAVHKNLKYLIIRECDSVVITEDIKELKNLEYLTIVSSKYLYIDSNIRYLNKLKSISLSENELKKFPEVIGLVPNLKEVYISGSSDLNWSQTFEVLKGCKKLKYLNLAYNGIEYLPENIYLLQNLKVLWITNKLKSLPLSIRKMPNLDTIYCNVGEGILESLPPDFEAVTNGLLVRKTHTTDSVELHLKE